MRIFNRDAEPTSILTGDLLPDSSEAKPSWVACNYEESEQIGNHGRVLGGVLVASEQVFGFC
jgi:hypothetical protein